jgi:hypothetical protein
MSDLEDKILKHNIPNKYSWWDKDHDDDGGRIHENIIAEGEEVDPDDKLTDMQKVQKWEEAEIPKPLQMAALNNIQKQRTGTCNTGVKGVLADYKEAKQKMEEDYLISQQIKEMLIERIANGAALDEGETSISAASLNQQKGAQRDMLNNYNQDGNDEESEDKEFIETYRQARLQQMLHARRRPVYGEICEVGPFEFADEVDKADSETWVIVHLYSPNIKECVKVNKHLEELARRMSWAKFLRMHSLKANMNIDEIALPVMMIYRNGVLEQNLVRVQDEMQQDWRVPDLQWLLENAGCVDPASNENAIVNGEHMKQNGSTGGGVFQNQNDEDDVDIDSHEVSAQSSSHVNAVKNASNRGENAYGGGGDYSDDDDDLDAFCEGFDVVGGIGMM